MANRRSSKALRLIDIKITLGAPVSRLFVSHSSEDSIAAVAFKQWLGRNGWAKDDVFLDVDNIGAGEVWKDALRKYKFRCEAVLLLASPDALDSPECLAELRSAEDYGKEIIVVLLRDLTISDKRLASYRDRQIVDLSAPPLAHSEHVEFGGAQYDVHFNNVALLKVKDYLFRRGITPDSFSWPPDDRLEADPFPGLSAFAEDEAGIFFGRETDILTGLDEIRLLRRNRSPRILAIQAASGAGKSSYLRAGLWPRLRRDPDYAPLAVVRPTGGILTGPEGLARKLAPRLSQPGAPVNPGDIAMRLRAADAAKTVAEFAELMTKASAQANEERRITNPQAPPPAILIAVDQAEELLNPEDAEESGRFLDLFADLASNPPAGVEPLALLTVRSDQAAEVFKLLADHGIEPPRTLMLLPVPQTSYRDIIRKPIEAAARRGQQITIAPALIDQLVADATGADALPLLAFTLSYLYQNFSAGGALTLEQYKALGGIADSIDKAVKKSLARPGDEPSIPAASEEQLKCLRATFIPWLANVDPESGQAKRRVAKRDDLLGDTRAMADRLVKARLLTLDRKGGNDTLEVAHESLLRQWPALTEWLHSVAEDLGIVASVERAAGEWERNGKLPAWLDHRGDRLSAAERVTAQDDFRRRLGPIGIDYLKACRAREKRQRRIALTIAWSLVAAFAVFSGLLFFEWRQTAQAQKETQASLLVAKSELDRENGNVAAAATEAEQAFRSIENVQTRSALLQAALEISPQEKAIVRLGSDTGEALAWRVENRLEVATDSGAPGALDSGKLQVFDPGAPAVSVTTVNRPQITRSQEGNPAHIRALIPLADGRMVAIFDTGAIGVERTNAIEVRRPASDISVNAIQAAVAAGPGAGLIALATADDTIVLYRCDWSLPAAASPCKAVPFGNIHGRAVAISPYATRIAVGNRSGEVTIYDMAATRIASVKLSNAAVNALSWAAQQDWLAAGTVAGEIAVLNVGDGLKPIQQQTFGGSSITAAAWAPNGQTLAFVCNGSAICLWQAHKEAGLLDTFGPAMRLDGHRQLITRLSFAASGDQLASAATDNSVRIWNLHQNRDASFTFYALKDAPIDQLAVSPDQHWLAGGGDDGTVEIWNPQSEDVDRFLNGQDGSGVQDLAWNRTDELAVLDVASTVRLVSSDPNKPTLAIPMKQSAGQHITWAGGDRLIAMPLRNNGLVLLDREATDRAPVHIATDHKQAWSVAAGPDNKSLLVSYVGGQVAVLDIASGKPVGPPMSDPLSAPAARIGAGSLSLSPDHRLLAVSGGDAFVVIYDMDSRTVWKSLRTGSADGIQTVAFSPDGKELAALGNNRRLYIWTINSGGAELYLDVAFVSRRAIVGDAANRSEHAGWLVWISNNQLALASGIAAIDVIGIDPTKWMRRIDGLVQPDGARLK
jgi:WD40 repeat protein